MKAIVQTRYGPPELLALKDLENPTPNDGEVLIKVRAASVNAYNWHMLGNEGLLFRLILGGMGQGFREPKNKIPQADLAGQVEAVGRSVTQFKPGDEVFGARPGGFGEYACVREKSLGLKPANLSFEEAAAVPTAALTALQGLRDQGQLQAGQKVLIYGASGGLGTFAVQIAKALGAEVTAVCSTRNLDMARSLGAAHVIDYSKEDFTRNVQCYDLIFAANGYRSLFDFKRALRPSGIFVGAGGSFPKAFLNMLMAPLVSKTGSQKFRNFIAKINNEDLRALKELIEAGKVVPVVERCYPLSEVREGFRYLGEGHARGKVVITITQNHTA